MHKRKRLEKITKGNLRDPSTKVCWLRSSELISGYPMCCCQCKRQAEVMTYSYEPLGYCCLLFTQIERGDGPVHFNKHKHGIGCEEYVPRKEKDG